MMRFILERITAVRRTRVGLAMALLAAGLAACGTSDRGDRSFAGPELCGDARLLGVRIGPVGEDAALPGCGAPEAVRVTAVAGVRLDPPATVNCQVGRRLADWVERGVQPASQRAFGRPVTSLKNAASYACRRRNNLPAGRLSEHARANAIDISEFRLQTRGRVPVAGGWSDPRSAEFLREVWRSACGPFTTVLGPEADRFHQDHFHLDVASRRSLFCR